MCISYVRIKYEAIKTAINGNCAVFFDGDVDNKAQVVDMPLTLKKQPELDDIGVT